MALGKEKCRVQVIVSKEMSDKIDLYSSKMGLSRSALCCQFIGQGIMGYDKAFDVVDLMAKHLTENAAKDLTENLGK